MFKGKTQVKKKKKNLSLKPPVTPLGSPSQTGQQSPSCQSPERIK